jgi:hypothetical protein
MDGEAIVADWKTLYGTVKISGVKHLLTYGGGGEGGFVFFYQSQAPGWHTWDRNWFKPPSYQKIDDRIYIKWEDGAEYIARVPENAELTFGEDEEVMELTEELMVASSA